VTVSSNASSNAASSAPADEFTVPWYWIMDKKEGYVAGMQQGPDRSDGKDFVTDRGVNVSVCAANIGPRILSASSLRQDFDDMVKMEEVNEPMILFNLRQRFARMDIYTNIGELSD